MKQKLLLIVFFIILISPLPSCATDYLLPHGSGATDGIQVGDPTSNTKFRNNSDVFEISQDGGTTWYTIPEWAATIVDSGAYDISTWNGDTSPTSKDSIRDYLALIDTDGDGDVDNIDGTVFGAEDIAIDGTWDSDNSPTSKNTLYDYIIQIDTNLDGDIDTLDSGLTWSPTGTLDFSSATITFGLQTTDIPDLSGTYETQLNNEAGLYAALSDVTGFFEVDDTIDISDNTNLAGTTNQIVLTGDTLSLHADIASTTTTEEISGIWEVQDDTSLNFGDDGDIGIRYDETTDDRLEIHSASAANTTVSFENNGSGNMNVSVDGTFTLAGNAVESGADVTDATNIASSIVGVAGKTTPVDADTIPIIDSAAFNVLKELTWANNKATLKTYFDTLYATTSTKLDDFTAPDDNTDLDATDARHGLLPKLSGSTLNYLRGDGTWAVPPGGGGSGTLNTIKEANSQVGDADIVTLDFDGSDFNTSETPDTEINITVNDGGIDHDSTLNYVPAEHIDWTSDQGVTDILAANIPDLSSVYAITAHTHTAMVDYTGAPAQYDIAEFTDANTIQGKSYSEHATSMEVSLESVLDLQDMQGAVTDGQVPNTITIDGEYIVADTIDDDSIDFTDVTLADLTFDVGSVDTTEFGYLNGVTSSIQAQLNAKEGTLTNSAGLAAALSDETGSGVAVFGTAPTFTTSITIGDATIDETELEILDGATLSTTELNYVDNVTSSIQSQLNAKEGTLTNSSGLASALSDETGSGSVVFNDTPTLVNPTLGTIASGVGTNLTALNGENIQDDTIDDDSIDWTDVTASDIPIDDTNGYTDQTTIEGRLDELSVSEEIPADVSSTFYSIGSTYSVVLVWDKRGNRTMYYDIYRAEGSAAFSETPIHTTADDVLTWTDTTGSVNTLYRYGIIAVLSSDGVTESEVSNNIYAYVDATIDGELITDDTIDDDSIDWSDVTSSDMTFDADTVTTTAVYSGTTSLEETTAADDSGAYIIGVYDEFTNSDSTTVQGVLADFDGAFQPLDSDLSTLAGITMSANVLAFLDLADYDEMALSLDTKHVFQPESLDDEDELTIDVGNIIHVDITGSAEPTSITIIEGGSEINGSTAIITNVSSNSIKFIDTAGVLELKSDCILDTYQTLTIKYVTDRWVEISRTTNTEYVSSINLAPTGTIQGADKIINTATNIELTTSQMGSLVVASDAAEIGIPPSLCTSATGAKVEIKKLTANAVSVYSLSANDDLFLQDGTNIGTNKMTLGAAYGSYLCLVCMDTNEWHVKYQLGTASNGGAGSSCTLYDSYEADNDNTYAIGYSAANRVYSGTVITPDSSIDICAIAYKNTSITDGGGIADIDYHISLINLDGNDLNLASFAGSSVSIDGSDLEGSGWNLFTFSSDVTISAATALVIYGVAEGDGPTDTAVYSSTNFVQSGRTASTGELDMDGGLIVTGGLQRWGTTGTRLDVDTNSDLNIRIYGKLTP